jgi:hypothetical protein
VKLRLAGNSLRLRLAPHEVAALGAGGGVETAVWLVPGEAAPFRYRLELRSGAGDPEVERRGDTLVVALPLETAREWIAGDAPGVYAELATGHIPLSLAVETDRRP